MSKVVIKSFVKQIKELDFSKPIVIDTLQTSQVLVNNTYSNLKKYYPEKSEKDLWTIVKDKVLNNNIFSAIMNSIIPHYDIHLDDGDINRGIHFLWQNPNFVNAPHNILTNIAKATIVKELILEDLLQKWNIYIDDNDVKLIINNTYKQSKGNTSIHDILNDKDKFEQYRHQLMIKKTLSKLISKMKYCIDWDSISNQFIKLK